MSTANFAQDRRRLFTELHFGGYSIFSLLIKKPIKLTVVVSHHDLEVFMSDDLSIKLGQCGWGCKELG